MSNAIDFIGSYLNKVLWKFSGTKQELKGKVDPNSSPNKEIVPLIHKVGAEGTVLLKNENNILPIQKGSKIAIFGRCQIDTFYTGYGSGGDVIAYYNKNILDAFYSDERIKINRALANYYREFCLENKVYVKGWGNWPYNYEEMPLNNTIVRNASKESEIAIVVIGRASGEDRDNKLIKGSYYLSLQEEKMLELVTANFDKVVVVLNTGNLIDFSNLNKYRISGLVLAYEGGMESGEIIKKIILGDLAPTGRLPFTIANNYHDYPSSATFGHRYRTYYSEDIYVGYRYFETFRSKEVLYPFGYGLGYSSFLVTNYQVNRKDKEIKITAKIKNIGKHLDQNVLEIYLTKPGIEIDEPKYILVGYIKTKDLKPNEEENIEVIFNLNDFKSFANTGRLKNNYIIEKGEYKVFAGNNVQDLRMIFSFVLSEDYLEETKPICPLNHTLECLYNKKGEIGLKAFTKKHLNLKKDVLNNLPQEYPLKEYKDVKFSDVINGKISLKDFVSQLSLEEMEALSRGDNTLNSPLGAKGNAGVYGGTIESLRNKGVPPITTCDGPSGIRVGKASTLLPIGLLLSSTWNENLLNELFKEIGKEMLAREVDVLLAPGLNIIRNPLCGRNFEYYSEDPYLSSKIASGVVDGLQSQGVGVAIKHFACNNQEFNRIFNDSIISERALREIYLRNFAEVIKKSNPFSIMTSYNKINGVYAHYNYYLVNDYLRRECNYKGLVMTDWWMRDARDPDFKKVYRQAYRVRSGVNLLMPGAKMFGKKGNDGTLLKSLGKKNGITLGEIENNTEIILSSIIRLKKK